MQKKTFRFVVVALVISSTVMLGFAGKIWYSSIYLDEQRTFWASIDNALSAETVTKTGDSNSAGQTIAQDQYLNFVGDISVLNKINVSSTDGSENIEVETRGFTDADYFKYIKVDLAEADQSANAQDAIGVWATNSTENGSDNQLLLESLSSSFVLFGGFNASTRAELMSKLNDGVYDIDFSKVSKANKDGRQVYSYEANIDILKFSKAFASYIRAIGEVELADSIEAGNYTNTVAVAINIDARSRNIISVVSASSATTNEIYTGQGVGSDVTRPESPIQFDELQKRLDE